MTDWTVWYSSNHDPSAHTQHRSLQIKVHRFDFIAVSPIGALQHFLGDGHPRTIPPHSLQEEHCSRLAATLLSALGLSSVPCSPAPPPAFHRARSPCSSLALGPRNFASAWYVWKCQSKYTLMSKASSRHSYPWVWWYSLPGLHTEGEVRGAHLTALKSPPKVLSLYLYPCGKVKRLQILAALSAQPRSFSRKVEMPPLNIKSWGLWRTYCLYCGFFPFLN